MKRLAVLAAFGLILLGPSAANAQSMALTSADLKEGATIANEQVFNGFGCTGGNDGDDAVHEDSSTRAGSGRWHFTRALPGNTIRPSENPMLVSLDLPDPPRL